MPLQIFRNGPQNLLLFRASHNYRLALPRSPSSPSWNEILRTPLNDMLNRCDFRCVLKVENVRDRRISTGRLFQARGPATAIARSPMVDSRVAGTRTSAVDAERNRRRESTSDSRWINSDRYCGDAPFRQQTGTLEHKVYTGCVQAHAASAGSRAVVSHGWTCAHQPWVVLQRSTRTKSDQGHAAAIQPGRRYSCRPWAWWTT